MAIQELDQLVNPYIRQLGINWKVMIFFGNVGMPQIAVNRGALEHRITLPFCYRKKLNEYRCDVVHELVHAHLAERIDPIFSTIYFHPSYKPEDPATREKMYMVYYSQQLVDIWVSDKMLRIDKKIAREEVATWLEAVLQIPESQFSDRRLELILSCALNQAQIKRAKFQGFEKDQERVLGKIRKVLGKDDFQLALKMGRLYTDLPELPMEKEQALVLFERKTQEACSILGFPIKPRLVQIDDDRVWIIEDRREPSRGE